MKRNEDIWLKKVKQSLDDYVEPVPPGGWERLSAELETPDEKRLFPYLKYAIAAAVVLLAVVPSVLFFLYSPIVNELPEAVVPRIEHHPDLLTPVIEPDRQAEIPVQSLREPRDKSVFPEVKPVKRVAEVIEQELPVEEGLPETTENRIPDERMESSTVQPMKEKRPVVRRPSGKEKLHLPVERQREKRDNRLAMGVALSGAAASYTSGNNVTVVERAYSMTNMGELANSSYITMPEDEVLVVKQGNIFNMKLSDVKYSHQLPVTVGISFRINLLKGFSVETGLMYTLLRSDASIDNGYRIKMDQKLHYLGIPVKASWNVVDKDRFTVYVSGGGMVEKSVYGEVRTRSYADTNDKTSDNRQKITVKPLQFSILTALGAQFDINRNIGIYVEPGVSYYFKDGSDVETIRKEHPFNFNLQMGMRFTY